MKAIPNKWWDEYSAKMLNVFPPSFDVFLELESLATNMKLSSVLVIPGLLQTEQYAESILNLGEPYSLSAGREVVKEIRLERQWRILGAKNPPSIHALIDEAAVRRTVGGKHVMHEQLQHLIDVAKQPNVKLQIVPFTSCASWLTFSAMISTVIFLYAMPDPPTTVAAELPDGEFALDSSVIATKLYLHEFDRLASSVLEPSESIQFMEQLADDCLKLKR